MLEDKKKMNHRLANLKFRAYVKKLGMDPDLLELDLTIRELEELWENFTIESLND